MSSHAPAGRRLTVPEFVAMKAQARKITMLTAYDYHTAALLDACGIEAILVGDSLSMVVQGHDTTLPVTLEEMIYHGGAGGARGRGGRWSSSTCRSGPTRKARRWHSATRRAS